MNCGFLGGPVTIWAQAKSVFANNPTFASAPCRPALFVLPPWLSMASAFEDEQRQLCQLWKKARKDGCMTPWQQAKAYGLNEAWQEMHGETTYGKAKWISDRVYVQGRGQTHPSPEAIGQLIKKMTADDDWFPGKVYGSLGGRPSVVSETNKSVMAPAVHRSIACMHLHSIA